MRDPEIRRKLRDIYLEGWYEYLAIGSAGLVPWAPVTDRAAESSAIAGAAAIAAAAAQGPGGFAEHLDEVPVLLLVVADLKSLAAVDRDLDRYTLVGGASIYPFCWSLLLAARDEGLGGVMTTMVVRREDACPRSRSRCPRTTPLRASSRSGFRTTSPAVSSATRFRFHDSRPLRRTALRMMSAPRSRFVSGISEIR